MAKQTTSKKTTKKTTGNKTEKVLKKNEEELTKETSTPKLKDRINKFINNPVPIIIVLIALNIILLSYIANSNNNNKIFVGYIQQKEVAVTNVHYFTNNDMNYFYASNALYIAEDKDIYAFEIGYYVKDSNGEFVKLASRSQELEEATSLSDVVKEMSGWNLAEAANSDYYFSDEVLDNIDNLYFRILASTEKGKLKTDINIAHKVEMTKVTR